MTNIEFLEITQEIEKFYEKELSTEQSRIWFDELKKITKERYRQISRECYKTTKFMPKLADIIEINKSLPNPAKADDGEIVECDKCGGTGLVCYKRKVEGYVYDYAARCECKNGMRLSKIIPSILEVGIEI